MSSYSATIFFRNIRKEDHLEEIEQVGRYY